jgi:NAD(P)-dependent dehydrogenase (short-subunit alcohol dehydrogenase family)
VEAQHRLSEFGDVRAIPADLSRHDECQRLADLVEVDSERLDILIDNAGAMWREPLETFPDEAWDAVIDLNLESPFWLMQALLPALRRAGTADDPARTINMGGIAAIHVAESPNYSYAGSEAGVGARLADGRRPFVSTSESGPSGVPAVPPPDGGTRLR